VSTSPGTNPGLRTSQLLPEHDGELYVLRQSNRPFQGTAIAVATEMVVGTAQAVLTGMKLIRES